MNTIASADRRFDRADRRRIGCRSALLPLLLDWPVPAAGTDKDQAFLIFNAIRKKAPKSGAFSGRESVGQ